MTSCWILQVQLLAIKKNVTRDGTRAATKNLLSEIKETIRAAHCGKMVRVFVMDGYWCS